MGLAIEARHLLGRMPPGLRAAIEWPLAPLPRALLYGSRFRRWRAFLRESERWPAERLRAWQDARVRDLVAHAAARVPYYREAFRERGLRAEHIRGVADLALVPLLTQEIVRTRFADLVDPDLRDRCEVAATGGTSGVPFRFLVDRDRSSREFASLTWQWERAGYRLGDRRASLRGEALPGADRGRRHVVRPLLDELVLSTHHLGPDTIAEYLERIHRFGARFLHAYPSSAETLCRLLRERPDLGPLRVEGLLLCSETVFPAQRALFAETLPHARVFSWYGHSEKCLLGAECERSTEYHFLPQYGVLEVLDEEGKVTAPGEEGWLVGTGFLNRGMPFLRYRTDDRGIVVPGPCECGRPYPRMRGILGRWLGEVLYGSEGQLFTMTSLSSHIEAFSRVRQYRFVQERPGVVELHVVPGPEYGPEVAGELATRFHQNSAGTIVFEVREVDRLERTERGKYRFVEQRIRPAGAVAERAFEEDLRRREVSGRPPV